jgi:transcriptional regulator with XRE-family HTH domain
MIRTMPQKTKRLPEGPFYRDLGRNLRVARNAAGKTQGEIAEYLDVSFQQIQKYEKGMNRIPVDSIVSLAAYLEVPILQLIAPTGPEAEFQSHAAKFGAKEFHRFMEALGSIKDRQIRSDLLNLMRRMAALKC